jgi:hypothetical protein
MDLVTKHLTKSLVIGLPSHLIVRGTTVIEMMKPCQTKLYKNKSTQRKKGREKGTRGKDDQSPGKQATSSPNEANHKKEREPLIKN